jgi:hypothetical protein
VHDIGHGKGIYRVGFLNSGGAGGVLIGDGIARALAGRGYRIGDDLLVENRSAEDDPGRLPGALKQLLDLRVDVVVTFSYPAAFAAKQGAGACRSSRLARAISWRAGLSRASLGPAAISPGSLTSPRSLRLNALSF